MLRDANLNFDTAAALTVTADSTNTLDLGVAKDLSATEDLMLSVLVSTTFAGGTSLAVEVQGSPDGSTWTPLASTGAIPVASLTKGAQLWNSISIPGVDPAGGAPYRYLKLTYTIVGTMTAGAVTSDMVMNATGNYRAYPSNFSLAAPTFSTFVPG